MDPNAEPSEYVTLASNDGFEFVISRTAACISGTIRRMLDPKSLYPLSWTWVDCGLHTSSSEHALTIPNTGNFFEARTGRCVFENMKFVIQ